MIRGFFAVGVLAAALATSLSACNCVGPLNPYDPDAPLATQARAALHGSLKIARVDFDTAIMQAELEALTVVLLKNGEVELRAQCVPQGAVQVEMACDPESALALFELDELEPGTYSLRIDGAAPDLIVPAAPTVVLAPGESRLLEPLRLAPVADEGGAGEIAGVVSLEGASGGSRQVTLYRKTGTGLEARATLPTDGDGNFQFRGLPNGRYAVSAELDGFTPALAPGLEVVGEDEEKRSYQLAGEEGLVLFPATAVLVPDVQRSFGVYYTNADEVPVQVLAFGGMTEMRLSTDPTFTTDGAADPFLPYSATSALTLPDEEGPISLYSQFRIDDEDGFVFTTGLFAAQVVRDVTAPAIVDVSARGRSASADGTVYLTSTGETLTLDIRANDAVSAVAGIAVHHADDNGAGDPNALVFTQLDAPGGLVQLSETVGLTDGEGEKRVYVYAKDRAGNVSAPLELLLVVDASAPVLGDEGAAIPPLDVINADAGVLRSRTASLAFHVPTGEEPPLEMRVGQDPLASTGAFVPFEESLELPVTGAHGASVSFSAVVRDGAGNTATVQSPQLTLDFSGTLSGTVLLEGVPAASPAHAGTTVRLYAAGAVVGVDAALQEITTNTAGVFSFGAVPEGSGYLVELSRAGFRRTEVIAPAISAGGTTSVGTITLGIARGNASGAFRLSDAADDATAHGGILVVAALDGATVAQTVTLADGSYSFPFPGLPVTVGNARYTISASRTAYAGTSVAAVQVSEDVTTIVNADPGDPLTPLPVDLAPLTGDFELCAATGPCAALLYTKDNQVRIKLRSETDVTDVRFAARNEFLASDGAPAWQGGYTPGQVLLVDISGADGVVEVFLQLEVNGSPGPVLSSTITLDTVAPTLSAFVVEDGPDALAPGFTNRSAIKARVTASAGAGDVAPLQSAHVAVSDAFPGALPAGAAACPHNTLCEVFLPGAVTDSVEEKLHTAWAYSCDRAGNCTTTQLSATIVYDDTPPQSLAGVSFLPTGDAVTTHLGTTYTRAAQYTLDLNVGTAETASGAAVLDTDGAPVPDVGAYRFIARYVGLGAPPTSPSFGTLAFTEDLSAAPGATLSSILAPALTGTDGAYRVYAQLKDLAGNTTALENNSFHADITLDTTAPGASFVLAGGAPYTSDTTVSVDITASPSDPVVTLWLARDAGLFDDYQEEALATPPGSASFDLATLSSFDGDGDYFLYGRFFDAAGNDVDRVDAITLDTTPPLAQLVVCGSCVESGGTLYSDGRSLLFDVLATDATSVVETTRVSVDGAAAIESSYAATVPVTLPDVDDAHTVAISFVDSAGNESAAVVRTVSLDRTAPSVSLAIDAGAGFTADSEVTLTLTSDADVTEMRLSNTGTFSGWQPLASQQAWSLASPSTDGSKTVFVEVRDAAGNVGSDSAQITLDTSPPAGSVSIGGGAYTTTSTVSLSLSHPNDTDGYAVANSALDCATTTYTSVAVGQTATNVAAHTLTAGDGPKTVVACFRDRAGNTALATDEIVLDTAAPAGTVSVENGAEHTQSASVDVYLTAPSDIAQVALGTGTLDCGSAVYESYAQVKTLLLPDPDGTKVVTVCFRDLAGNTATASDSIVLDRSDPAGTLAIDGDATYTTSRSVTLALSAPVDTTHYAATDGTTLDCGSATYSPFTSNVPWTLPDVQGAVSVTVCFKDASGRTGTDTDSIIVDTSPPSGGVSIAAGADYTTTRTVAVALSHPTDVDGYALANGALECAGATYTDITPGSTSTNVAAWQLTIGEGDKTVSACFRDAAGHKAGASDSIYLDLLDPSGTVFINSDDGFTTTTNVTLTLSPAPDIDQLAIANGSINCNTASYAAYTSSSVAHVLAGPDGVKNVSVCFKDAAGRTFRTSDTIVLDRQAPVISSVLIESSDAANVYATSTGVILRVTASDAPAAGGVVEVLVSEDASFTGASWIPFGAGTIDLALSSTNGTKTLYAKVRDAAGNESSAVSDTIILDTEAPAVTLTHDGSGFDDGSPVSVRIEATDNVSDEADLGMAFSDAATPGGLACPVVFTPFTSPADVTIGGGQGVRYIQACVQDEAGNVGRRTMAVTIDLSDPGEMPDPAVTAGSRRIQVSWVEVSDIGPAGIHHYDVRYDTDPGFSSATEISVSGGQVSISGLTNRVQYFVATRAVDRAGRAGPWSQSSPAVPGVKRTVFPVEYNVDSPQHTSPSVFAHGGHVWVTLNETRAPNDVVRVLHCEQSRFDCRDTSNWDSFAIDIGVDLTQLTAPMAVVGERLWMAITQDAGANSKLALLSCDLTGDCTAPANWALSNDITSASMRPEIKLTSTASGLFLFWTENSGALKVSSCFPLVNDCLAGGWTGALTIAPADTSPLVAKLDVGSNDRAVWAYVMSGGQPKVTACNAKGGCNTGGQWSTPYLVATPGPTHTLRKPTLVATPQRLYAMYQRDDSVSSARELLIARCDTASGCNTQSDWSAPSVLVQTVDPGDPLSAGDAFDLGTGGGELHLVRWDAQLGALEYGVCQDLVIGDCTLPARWARYVVDENVPLETHPSTTMVDRNFVAAYYDVDQHIRLLVPAVASPVGHAVVPGVDFGNQPEGRSTWSSLVDLAGYEQLIDTATPGPDWGTSLSLGDAYLDYNRFDLLEQDYWVSLRAYDDVGDVSDDAAEWRVRPFTAYKGGSLNSLATTPDCPVTGVNCASYAFDSDGRYLLTAYTNASGNYVRICDKQLSDCRDNANWKDAQLTSDPDFIAQQVVVAGSQAYALYEHTTNRDAHLYRCNLGSGCAAKTDWVDAVVVNNTGTAPNPQLAWSSGLDRLYVGYRNDANRLLFRYCTASNCTTTTPLTPGSPLNTSAAGYSMAAHGQYLVAASPSGTTLFMQRYWSGDGTFFNGTVATNLNPASHSVRIGLTSDARMGIAFIENNRLDVLYCPFDPVDCRQTDRWGRAFVSKTPANYGISVDLIGSGTSLVVAYRHSQVLHIAQCGWECQHPGSWFGGEVARVIGLHVPNRGARTLWKTSANRIGIGSSSGAQGAYVLDDGKSEGPY